MTAPTKLAIRNGFTLIELLIALMILSILSFLAYKGVSSLLMAERRLDEDTKRMQMIDRLFSEFERDVLYAAPRPVRIATGKTEPAIFAISSANTSAYRINLSRFAPASDMPPQRISYIIAAPNISVTATAKMDFPVLADEKPVIVLDGLQSAAIRFLDTDGRWSDTWPPAARIDTMPVAVEIILVLNDLGTVSRLIARP